MVEVRWLASAKIDLQEIFEYISSDSERYAHLQVDRIIARTDVLKNQPRIGRAVPEYTDPDVKEIFEGNYRIVYRIIDSTRVDILMVHHTARDLRRRLPE